MRGLIYTLLVGSVLQLAVLRGVCVPRTAPAQDCCPPAQESPAPTPADSPDCCLISGVRYQGSLGWTKTSKETANPAVQVQKVIVFRSVREAVFEWRILRAFAHPIPPPLSPLLQTCLLLI